MHLTTGFFAPWIFSSSSFEIHAINIDDYSGEFFYVQTTQQRHDELSNLLLAVKTRNRLRNALYRKKRLANTFNKTANEAKNIIYIKKDEDDIET